MNIEHDEAWLCGRMNKDRHGIEDEEAIMIELAVDAAKEYHEHMMRKIGFDQSGLRDNTTQFTGRGNLPSARYRQNT